MAVKEIWTPRMNADWQLAEANKPEANYEWLDDSYHQTSKTYVDPVSGDTATFSRTGSTSDRIETNPNYIWRDDDSFARLGHKSKNAYFLGCGYNCEEWTNNALVARRRLVRLPHVCGITMQYRWPDACDSDYGHMNINGNKGCWFSYFSYQTMQRTYLRCEACDATGPNPTNSSYPGVRRRGMDWKVMAFRLNATKRDYVKANNLDFIGFIFQFEYPATSSNFTRVMDLNHLNLIFDTRVSGVVPILFQRKLNPWDNDPIATGLPQFFLTDPS